MSFRTLGTLLLIFSHLYDRIVCYRQLWVFANKLHAITERITEKYKRCSNEQGVKCKGFRTVVDAGSRAVHSNKCPFIRFNVSHR